MVLVTQWLGGLLAAFCPLVGAAQIPLGLMDSLEAEAKLSAIPTRYESAVMGRRILALTKLATLSTVFQKSSSNTQELGKGDSLDGIPLGLVDYVADCEDVGNPTLLAFTIGSSFRNVRQGSNLTISLHWVPPYPPSRRIALLSGLWSSASTHLWPHHHSGTIKTRMPDTVPYSAANLPRFSLFGYLEPMSAEDVARREVARCYTEKHPDAKCWLPEKRVHESAWSRLVVTKVYWVGGFGDRAYIGWIPAEEWKQVKREQWESIRLPGEDKGWSEDRLC